MELSSRAREEEKKQPSDVDVSTTASVAGATVGPALAIPSQQPSTSSEGGGGGKVEGDHNCSLPEQQDNSTPTGENGKSVYGNDPLVVDKETITTTIQEENTMDHKPVAQNTMTILPQPQQNSRSSLTFRYDNQVASSLTTESLQPPVREERQRGGSTEAAAALESSVSPPLEKSEASVTAPQTKIEAVTTSPALVATAVEGEDHTVLGTDKTTSTTVEGSSVETPSSPRSIQTTVVKSKSTTTQELVTEQQQQQQQDATNDTNAIDHSSASPRDDEEDEEEVVVEQSVAPTAIEEILNEQKDSGEKSDSIETKSIDIESKKAPRQSSSPTNRMGAIEAEVARRLHAEEEAIRRLEALRKGQRKKAPKPLVTSLTQAVTTGIVPPTRKELTKLRHRGDEQGPRTGFGNGTMEENESGAIFSGRDERTLPINAGEVSRRKTEELDKAEAVKVDKTKAVTVDKTVKPIESIVDKKSLADEERPTKHSAQTPGMSTLEFLRRSAVGPRPKLGSQPQEAHRKKEEDDETRVVAAGLSSLRRAGAHPYSREGHQNGGNSDQDLPAATRFLSSRAHQGDSGQKRSSSPLHGDKKRPAKRRKSSPERSIDVSPRVSVVPDADAMAQIGELPPAVIPPRAAAVDTPVNVAVPPSAPTLQHDKAFLVEQATELVCRALLDGPWPCVTEFSVVVAALHQFASDIIVPALYAADPQPTVVNDTPIILGTLLMLREALILNADPIFGIANGGEQGGRPGRDSQGEYFAASTLATSILLAALDSLGGMSAATYAPRFLRIIDAYESGQGDFAQLMMEEDADPSSSVVLYPDGNPMQEEDADAWRASHR